MPVLILPITMPLSTDQNRTDDIRIRAIRPLIAPALLQEQLPASEAVLARVEQSRQAICDVLHARDDRLLVVVGPCSIHDHGQAMEYAHWLQTQAKSLEDDLLIVMRCYFEKPRTTVGWKGYINDPRMDGSFSINEGLALARALLLDIVKAGLAVGTEFLDLLSPQYISDLVSWGAIGARTTESQSHRQLASGLSCPVGFKNGTDGGIKVAVDAMLAAQSAHAFMGMTKWGQAAVFETQGNADCHIILRGGKQPNYSAADVQAAARPAWPMPAETSALSLPVETAQGRRRRQGATRKAAKPRHHEHGARPAHRRRPDGGECCAMSPERQAVPSVRSRDVRHCPTTRQGSRRRCR